MSTDFRFAQPVSEAKVREAAENTSLVIETDKHGTTVSDGTNYVHVFFVDGQCTGFCRYGYNDESLVYRLGDELGVTVFSEHDDEYFTED